MTTRLSTTTTGRVSAALFGVLAVLATVLVGPGATSVHREVTASSGHRSRGRAGRVRAPSPDRGGRVGRPAGPPWSRPVAVRWAHVRSSAGGAGRHRARRPRPDRSPSPSYAGNGSRPRTSCARPRLTRTRTTPSPQPPAEPRIAVPAAATHPHIRHGHCCRAPPEATRVPSTTRPRPDRPGHRRGLHLHHRHHSRPPRPRPARRHPDRPGDPGLADREGRTRSPPTARVEVLRRRVDALGVAEPTLTRSGDRRIIVELPGVQDPREAAEVIGRTAQLTFHPVVGDAAADPGRRHAHAGAGGRRRRAGAARRGRPDPSGSARRR